VALLADAGCTAVGVGIESGSERLRRKVLGRGERDRITNLQRLFGYAVEFPEVGRHFRWLIDRPASQLYGSLFRLRHRRAMRNLFSRVFQREPEAPGRNFPDLDTILSSVTP